LRTEVVYGPISLTVSSHICSNSKKKSDLRNGLKELLTKRKGHSMWKTIMDETDYEWLLLLSSKSSFRFPQIFLHKSSRLIVAVELAQ